MSTSQVLRKIARNAEDHGWLYTFTKSLQFLINPFYAQRVYRIYKIDLRRREPRDCSDAQGLSYKVLGPDDSVLIRQVEECHEWLRGTLRDRIKSGAVCLVASEGDRLAGFNLVSLGKVFIPLINRDRVFRPGEAWSEQIAVMKEFRKRGVGSELRHRIFEELRKRSIRKFYGGALVTNIPSLKLARSVGFREFVDVRYRKILGRESWNYTRVGR